MTEEVVYQVEQETFTGPFDLLLKAIDDNQIDVFQVSLTQITSSYFEFWKQSEPKLELASDFLIMAAYLLELKSKNLLPLREEFTEEDLVGNVEAALVDHLQEYEVYKGLAQTLRQRKDVFERVYGRHEGEPQEKEIELVDVSLKDLVLAFKKVYDDAAKREAVVPIPAEEVSLDDRIIEVKRLLAGRKDGVPFVDIFIRKTRLEIVVTFLAVLELTKQKFLKVTQGRRFGSILLFAREVYEKEYGNNNNTERNSGSA